MYIRTYVCMTFSHTYVSIAIMLLFYFFVATRKRQQREESSDTESDDGKISYDQFKMSIMSLGIYYSYHYYKEEFKSFCDSLSDV